jgi:hypothetical protein|tara:strand:+ start:122 stop:1396 length:1275 start_codon:yes stop_codon:yes gene_type:complete
MNDVEQAKVLAALLGVLQKQNTKLKKQLTEELLKELDSSVQAAMLEGPQGEKGETGLTGEKGDQGLQGIQGERGLIGEQGPQGIQGLQGIQGETGEQGPQGEIGPRGPEGPKGLVGPIGKQGPQGTQGERGLLGEQGEPGPQGPQGEVGPQGLTGPAGPKGEVGETGAPGLQGPKGEQGPIGLRGEPGVRGEKGDQGPEGPAGPKGETGDTPDLKPIVDDVELFKAQVRHKLSAASGGGSSGGGEVRLEFLDDVDRDSVKVNDKFLKFNSSTGKFVGATVDTSANVDLTSVTTSIVPSSNNTLNLGSNEKRWKELFLSGNTINLGGATISSDGTGTISISGAGAVLPQGSKVEGPGTAPAKTLATLGDDGVVETLVPLFTQSSGLSSPATTFVMRADTTTTVFTGFTLNNGRSLARSKTTLFFF